MEKDRRESDQLPKDIAERLNETFYRTSPATYFEMRLVSLHALDALPEGDLPASALADEVLGREIGFSPTVLDRAERETFIAAEAEVLLDHVSEVLVRYVLGHVGWPRCPWLEIAALSDHREFKKQVAELRATDREDLDALLEETLLGNSSLTPEERSAFMTGIADTVAAAAGRVLESAPLYNAAKHGFAVIPGRFEFAFRAEPEGEESEEHRREREAVEAWLSDRGLTLESLEWTWDEEAKARSWRTAMRFVEPSYSLAMAWLTIRVLGNVARVLKARYSGGGEVSLHEIDDDITPKAIRARAPGKRSIVKIPVMARPLKDDAAAGYLAGLDEAGRSVGGSEG